MLKLTNVNATAQVRTESITRVIHILQEQKVLLDAHLAALYGVPTKRFNEQVKRKLGRSQ